MQESGDDAMFSRKILCKTSDVTFEQTCKCMVKSSRLRVFAGTSPRAEDWAPGILKETRHLELAHVGKQRKPSQHAREPFLAPSSWSPNIKTKEGKDDMITSKCQNHGSSVSLDCSTSHAVSF